MFLGALILLPLALPFCAGRAAAEGHFAAAHCPMEQLHETISHIDLMRVAAPLVAAVNGQQILLLSVFLIAMFSVSILLQLAVKCLYQRRYNNYIRHMSPWSFMRDLLADGVMHPKIY